MHFTAGLVLGPVIGAGYFGDVHSGQDPLHGTVAVKVLRRLAGETTDEWERRKENLLNEAQHLKAAEHGNVVRVLNIIRGDADDLLHMVTEFCNGGSVQSEYEAGPVRISRLRRILTDVCLGMDVIHQRGMLHRDVKPANILRANNRWKIGDFGLVSDDLIFGYASAQGYLDHLAPEVHRDRLTSVQSDIWALGMTAYRLLHGAKFYQDNFDGSDVPAAIQNGGFASRLKWLPHIPVTWRKFIRKAMHDNRGLRFGSVFAVSQALATLPILPDWSCDYDQVETIWTRQKEGRRIRVLSKRLSPNKHTWEARSIGGTRDRLLGGTAASISGTRARAELEDFFSRST